MPVCNMCAEPFDVEVKPGGLLFGHPSTVTQCVPVPKAHLCQECEAEIIGAFKLPPIDPQADRLKELEHGVQDMETKLHNECQAHDKAQALVKELEVALQMQSSIGQRLEARVKELEAELKLALADRLNCGEPTEVS